MKKLLLIALAATVSLMPAMAAEIIKDTPAGTLYDQVSGNSASAWRASSSGLGRAAEGGYPAKFVINGSEIYIHNVVSEMEGLDSWIKGTLDAEGNATFTFPQPAMQTQNATEPDRFYNIMTLSLNNELVAATGDANVLRITWDGTTLRQVLPESASANPYEGAVCVSTTTGKMGGFANRGVIYHVVADAAVLPPADMATKPYALTGLNAWDEAQPAVVQVGFAGSDMWIKGIYPLCPEGWIRGTVDGNKVTFASGQFQGLSSLNYYMYFYGAEKADNRGYTQAEQLTLTLGEDGAYTAENPFLYNFGNEYYVLSYGYYTARFEPQSTAMPTPADPYELEKDYEDGLGLVGFNLDPVDTEGNPIDRTKLYYRIYLDDQLYELDADLYGMSGSEIPYDYTDDAMIMYIDAYHLVAYFENPAKVGVQAIYRDGDEVTYSKLVEVGQGGIHDAAVDINAPAVYYNLQGLEVKGDLTPGLYIRRQGNTASKVLVK